MSIQEFLADIGVFINYTLIPFLFALALFVFIFNVARYFILGATKAGNSEKGIASGREKARKLALYGVAAFVFLVSIWGIVNLLVSGFNIGNDRSFCPDYMGDWCLDSGNNSSNGNGWFFEFEFSTGGGEEEYTEPFRGPR